MTRQLSDKLLWLCLLLMTACMTAFNNSSLSSISILLFTGLMLLICAFAGKGKIQVQITKYHRMVAAFALFCLCSAVWAEDSSSAITDGISIFEILVCMSVVFCCFRNAGTVRGMLTALMWSGPILGLYTVYYYGPSQILQMVSGGVRLGNDYANANTVGVWAAISTILFYYFILHDGWKWKHCAVALPVALVALSQSRKAAAVLIFALILVQFFRNGFQKQGLKGLIRLILGLTTMTIGLILLSRTQLFAGTVQRILDDFGNANDFGQGDSLSSRIGYIQAGLEQFLKTPVLGIGIRNSYLLTRTVTGLSTYLHNNFVELLACGGIVGFCLYYRITGHLALKLWRSMRRAEEYSDICFVILIMYTCMDLGVVSYYRKETYLLFLICYLQTVFVKENAIQNNKLMDAKNCLEK